MDIPKYEEREGRQLEFKREITSYQGVIRTVIAFLNDIGGLIIIGVEDGTRAIQGLSDTDVETYLETIPKVIADAVEPYAPTQIRTRTFGDRTIVEVEVFPGDRKPYFVRSEGVPKGVYVRFGAHTKRASTEIVDDLERLGRGKNADSEPVKGIGIGALDTLLLTKFYRGAMPDIATLRSEKIIVAEPVTQRDFASVAAVVLFHPEPNRVLPQAELLYTEFQGATKQTVTRTVDLSAPLPMLINQVFNLVEPTLTTETKRHRAKLVASAFSIPPLAIREALLNALIHRRYTAPAPVKVSLFADRLEIFSPGNFPGPISNEEMGNGISYYRNPTLASLARRLGLVERRGLGFYNILTSCRENGNPRPDIVEGADHVKVMLFRTQKKNEGIALPDDLLALEPFRAKRTPLTTSLVRSALGVSAGTARSKIYELVERGILIERGKGRATRYEWK